MNRPLFLLSAVLALASFSSAQRSAPEARPALWTFESSGTSVNLHAIRALSGGLAWVSGANGTILHTEDDGKTWQACPAPSDGQGLDFRAIQAFDGTTILAMSSGKGNLSRLYKSVDGCAHWRLLYVNPASGGYWDVMRFIDNEYGYLVGDPVGGQFVLLDTKDGGESWTLEAETELISRQGVIPASNSALAADPDWGIRFGTSGPGEADVLSTTLAAQTRVLGTWRRVRVPIAGTTASQGIASLDFRDASRGVAVGGDFAHPEVPAQTAAWTDDGGQHWTASKNPPHGYRSAVQWNDEIQAYIAVGPNGADISYDDGRSWTSIGSDNWTALGLPWVVGPGGRIAKIDLDQLRKKKR
ncbi:hypothetical protein [Paracidobacterium acidisoli]|uniref:hypothetical protein n=1 Tax=Paracidobacterium acidisoli TaxID=2303751 RepID=UPI0011C1D0D7|nr:hypothetical protein [Paracidobacterium acidisoli]MBT9332797.1 hypothetical protein [Paracidobacterium acidisoli]